MRRGSFTHETHAVRFDGFAVGGPCCSSRSAETCTPLRDGGVPELPARSWRSSGLSQWDPHKTAVSSEQEKALQKKYAAYRGVDADYRHAGPEAIDRWMDWKWGLRIHWGLYCMVDGPESWIITKHRTDKEWQKKYYTMYQDFNPTGFNADEWMEIMQRAGMKYFSFTSKHHEGFCFMAHQDHLQRGWKPQCRRELRGGRQQLQHHGHALQEGHRR